MELNMRVIGALAQDCEVKHFENGMCVINFSVPHSEKYLNKKNEKVERTTWVNCALWRKSDKTKISEFLTKGVIVSCVGMPSVRAWVNDKNEAHAALELRVEDLRLLTFNKNKPENVSHTNAPVSAPQQSTVESGFLAGPGVNVSSSNADAAVYMAVDKPASPNDDLPF